MKGKSLLLAVSFLLLLVLAASAQPQPNPTLVKIMPHWAQQGFNPLNPSAVGHPVITANAMMANAIMNRFTITNYSKKAVTSIEYGWRISAPAACADSTFPVHWETASANVSIAPGAEANITTAESLSRDGAAKDLAEQAQAANTPVVLVTVGIVKATFADGTTWTDDEALERNTFDGNLYEKHEGCQSPTVSKRS